MARSTAGPYRLETELEGFDPAVRKVALEPGQTASIDVTLAVSRLTEALVVTARRTEEVAQEVPIPVSVVGGGLIEDTGAFNVNRLKDLLPTVQFYSTNPRNSAVNIRGLGAPFGLTNDGIEQGVGIYIDGVFYARPAAATLDFLDVERIEVLRGPQGTLFGKNTTAGAINVTTRKPSFTPEAEVEINYGSFGFVQAEGSISGPLSRTSRRRARRSRAPQRGGVVGNTATRHARQRPEQSGRARAAALHAVRPARAHLRGRSHAPAARGLHAGGRRRRADACAPPTGSTRRSRRISATRRPASTPSIGSPTSTRRCARTRTWAASRSRSTGSSVAAS